MSYKRNSSNTSIIDDSSATTENSILAKLRRLKIEENLLTNSINKINIKETDRSNSELPILYSSELKNYTERLKNSLTEMKNMFGELKVMAEETLTSDDIENMKRDVVKLDEKIRLIKSYVQTELAMESTTEKELTQQENYVEERQLKCSMKPKIRIKPFNNIVPSPVKVMIQSPFKCQEVQHFQEFMMSSPNRYGGWNEYHHNVFVQIWKKHFKSIDEIAVIDAREFTFYNQGHYQSFQTEILEKITGSTEDDVLSHYKWYCKYLILKEQQQNALNKWKRNKRMLLKPHDKVGDIVQKSSMDTSAVLNSEAESRNFENVEEWMDTMETCDAEEIANALCEVKIQDGLSIEAEINMSSEDRSQDAIKRKERSFNDILKPTKQWTNRCNSSSIGIKVYHDVETIKKLRIPDWRMPLKD